MKIEKNRHLIILHQLMENRENYISSEYLASKTMASVRSIKSDISYLNHSLQRENIASITSKSSRGYQLVPLDEEAFEGFAQTLQVHQILFQNRSIEEMNRRLYIIQKLLVSDYCKIDDLADALFLSRSSLTKDIAWSTRFLQSFHLKVVSVPGRGLHLEGKEQDIRSAMIEVYCSQYHDIELLYPVEEFQHAFRSEVYEDVRHTMLKTIRESDLTISDIAAKKIAAYLCLVPNRKKVGEKMTFDEYIIGEIKDSYEYHIAESIHQDEEEEMINLARLLIVNKDIHLGNNIPAHITEDVFTKGESLMERFVRETGYVFFQSDIFHMYEKEFLSVLLRLVLQNRYDHTGQYRLVTYTETGENNVSPLAMEYTRMLIVFLEEQFNEKIRSADSKAFTAIFHRLLKKIPLEYQKMHLAVFSMEGRAVAQLMKEELINLFPDYIASADVYNLYEMRKLDFQQYDATISSWDVAYYKYPIPLISYKGVHLREDREKLFGELFIHGYSMKIISRLKQIIHCFKDVRMHDYMELIQSLAEKYGKDQKHVKKIVDKAVNRFSAVSYYNSDSGISMIFLDYEDTSRELVDIYVPSETVYWGTGMEIRYFITVSINPEIPLSDLSAINLILQELSRKRELVEKIVEGEENILVNMYMQILKDHV